MSVIIGHARKDENSKYSGGQAGDQTGSEVSTSSWYNNSWNLLLRPKTSAIAEKSAKFVEDVCNNSNVGYDQGERNTLYAQAKAVNFDGSKIKTPCECDCSSLVHVAAIAGGANVQYGSNGATTWTLKSVIGNSGDYEILTDNIYFSSDTYLKRGDIIVKTEGHAAMVLSNGSKVGNTTTDTANSSVISAIYKVQVGAFSVKSNADSFLQKVKLNVSDAFIVHVNGLYKIQVGAFSVKTNAENYLTKMKNLGYTDAFITK